MTCGRRSLLALAKLSCHSDGPPWKTPTQVEPGVWKYLDGNSFALSLPAGWRYGELLHHLGEKFGPVGVNYLPPGEDLQPDNLITVMDDDDLAVCAISGQCARAGTHAGGPLAYCLVLTPDARAPATPRPVQTGAQIGVPGGAEGPDPGPRPSPQGVPGVGRGRGLHGRRLFHRDVPP